MNSDSQPKCLAQDICQPNPSLSGKHKRSWLPCDDQWKKLKILGRTCAPHAMLMLMNNFMSSRVFRNDPYDPYRFKCATWKGAYCWSFKSWEGNSTACSDLKTGAREVPVVAQWKWIRLGTMRLRVWSLALLSGLRIRCCCGSGLGWQLWLRLDP